MSRLTKAEKYEIQQGVLEGKSVKDIAKKLGRAESTIKHQKNKFFKDVGAMSDENPPEVSRMKKQKAHDELEALKNQVKVLQKQLEEVQQSEPEAVQENPHGIQLREDIIIETIHKLRKNGIDQDDAKLAIRKVESELVEPVEDAARLTGMCLRKLNVLKSMIREGAGGRKGVAVMTGVSSAIAEEQAKYHSPTETKRKCLFNPKTGEVT